MHTRSFASCQASQVVLSLHDVSPHVIGCSSKRAIIVAHALLTFTLKECGRECESTGGEAQRIKLARDLSKKATGSTLYVLDEPTTGLHFVDVTLLIGVLQRLVDGGNTVIVIEHNLDVIARADHVIDLGPEGGSGGGQVLTAGTPAEVAKCKESHTGRVLGPVLSRLTAPTSSR